MENKITIKANQFDFKQMLNKKIEVYFTDIKPITNAKNEIINYDLFFTLENVPNAVVKYTLYKLDKLEFANAIKPITALQLKALGLIKEEKIKGYNTGRVIFSIDAIKKSVGGKYEARLFLMDEIDNASGKQYQWKLLLPSSCDMDILEQIRATKENSKYTLDVMDRDTELVSFDSLRDNELNEISE